MLCARVATHPDPDPEPIRSNHPIVVVSLLVSYTAAVCRLLPRMCRTLHRVHVLHRMNPFSFYPLITRAPAHRLKAESSTGQLFVYDGACRDRVVSGVFSTRNQQFQPRHITGMVDLITPTVVKAVEAEAPPPRRQRRLGWCECAQPK